MSLAAQKLTTIGSLIGIFQKSLVRVNKLALAVLMGLLRKLTKCYKYILGQSVANIQINSNIRIFLAKYLIFEYKYKKLGIRIYSNIWTIEKLGYEYIRIFVNFLRIYSNILLCERVQSFQQAISFGISL